MAGDQKNLNMFTHYRSQGFVLKEEKRGEADKVFIVFTKDFGKLKISGKAIRKIRSKLRAGIQPFYLSEIEFIQGKNQRTLTDAISLDKFPNIKKNFNKLRIISKITEVFNDLVKGEEPDEKLWNLLLEVFKGLDSSPSSHSLYSLIYYYFIWNLFSILGYKPIFDQCIVCQKKLVPDTLYFEMEQGGLMCGSCFKRSKKGEKTEVETIKILKVLLEKKWKIFSKLKIKTEHQKNLKKISEDYLAYLYEALDIS